MKKIFAHVIAALLISTVGAVLAAPAKQGIMLGKSGESVGIARMRPLDDKGLTCVVGATTDIDAMKTYGRLFVIDGDRGEIVWQKKVPAPDGADKSTFVDCVKKDGMIYVAANVDTSTSPPLSQALVYVYKFDANGKQLGLKQLLGEGRDKYAYGLGLADGQLWIISLAKDQDGDNVFHSLFSAKIDDDLNFSSAVSRATGAFQPNSKMSIIGNDIYMAGNFYPHKSSDKDGSDDFAVSKIQLGGGYLWSQRPLHIFFGNIASYISNAGKTYILGYSDSATTIDVIGSNGKVESEKKIISEYCDIDSMSAINEKIYAIRRLCRDSSVNPSLVMIDTASGKEVKLPLTQGKPRFVDAYGTHLNLVSKDTNGIPFYNVNRLEGSGQ